MSKVICNSVFRKICRCHSFDLFAYTAGTQILKLMLGITAFGIFVNIGSHAYENAQRSINHSNSAAESQLANWAWFESIISWLVLSAEVFCLWKGIKTRSRKYLKTYAILGTVYIVPQLSRKIYLGYIDNPGILGLVISGILQIVLISLRLYGVVLVVKCYRKLESPLMLRLYKYCGSLKENQDTKFIENGKSIISKNTTTLNITAEGSINYDVDQKEFEKHIISPLDFIIDTSCTCGQGQFGSVYKGVFCFKKEKFHIAAKVVNNPEDSETFSMLLQEIKIMIRAGEHENIVKFYGVTSDASIDEHFAIVTEFCSRGSLDNFLEKNRQTFINFVRHSGQNYHPELPLIYTNLSDYGTHSSADLVRFGKEIARGMEHLASIQIIHGDLAARNVLLTDNLKAKLTDFGMSRRLYNYQQYSKLQTQQCFLPWRWLSVEALEDLKFSEKSDIWSFGVLLWEIFTLGDFPYKDVQWSPSFPNELRSGELRLAKPSYATSNIYKWMLACWNINENNRPSFSQIRKAFEDNFKYEYK